MEGFIKHFVRDPDGSWRCLSFAVLRTDTGRVEVTSGALFTPGTIFMGVDIVKMLEQEAARQRQP